MLDEITTTNEDTMAVTKKELEGLTGKQLKKFMEDAAQLLQERKEGRIQELRAKWSTEAEEEGLSVMEILGIRKENGKGKPKDGTRTPAKAKYQLSDGSTYSGKGRIPILMREQLKGAKGWDAETATFDTKENRMKGLEQFLIER